MMKKILLFGSVCLILAFGSNAYAVLQAIDIQDSTNHGDWFLPPSASPQPGQSGYSLEPIIDSGGKNAPVRPTFFEAYSEPPLLPPRWMSMFWTWAEPEKSPSLMGFVMGNLKVVSSGNNDALKIYRLSDVFSKVQQLPSGEVEVAKISGYREQLDTWFKDTNRDLAPQGHLSKQDLEMLKSLGYASP